MTNDELLSRIGVDTRILIDRFCGNIELAMRFLKKFPSDPNFETLQKAIEDGDEKKIEMSAHTLKGLCANLELKALSEAAAEIVAAVRGGQTDKLESLFDAFKTVYLPVCETLNLLV